MSDSVEPHRPINQPADNPSEYHAESNDLTRGFGGDSESPSMEAVDREVEEAMAAMDASDLAELSGGETRLAAETSSESLAVGTELTGTVVGVTDDEVYVEFGPKAQGVLARTQFGKKELVEVGRRVDVVVERYDPDSDMLRLNRKGAIQRATWTSLTVGTLLQGRITGMNKGGLEVDVNGIRAFMPASQADTTPMKDISILLNQMVQCEVVEVDRRQKNLLVSRRKVLERQAAEEREKLKAELEAGQVRKGVVGNITEYGAFVDIGGIDGLLHIRDLSWRAVEKVTDVVQTGDEIEVQVLKVDHERGRISLGLKQCQPDPWKNAAENYPVGSAHKARVVRLQDFGVFAELEMGVEGLVPISEMGWARVNRTSDVVAVGDIVDVVVIRFEANKRRIALSMKQASKDPWEGVQESFEPNAVVSGRVTRLADFGAFVEVASGVEAMVHISELSESRVRSCAEVLQVGQVIEAKVLGVDQESRRISLSLKALTAPSSEPQGTPHEVTAKKKSKKRKRPLRGGLASHFDW